MHVTWNVAIIRTMALTSAIWTGACQADNYSAGPVTLTPTADGYSATFGSGTAEKSEGSNNIGCPVVVQDFCILPFDNTGHYNGDKGQGTNGATFCAGSVNNSGGKRVAIAHAPGCSGDGNGYVGTASLGGTTSTYNLVEDDRYGEYLCVSLEAGRQISGRYETTGAQSGNVTCLELPERLSCSAYDVELDHGSLSPAEFDENSLTKNVNVKCTGDASVTLSLSPASVALSNGGTSSLSTNHPSGTPLNVRANVTATASVTSVLHGQVGPGDFHGSTTLTVKIE